MKWVQSFPESKSRSSPGVYMPSAMLTAWILKAFSPAQEYVTARAARERTGISYVIENPLNIYYKEL